MLFLRKALKQNRFYLIQDSCSLQEPKGRIDFEDFGVPAFGPNSSSLSMWLSRSSSDQNLYHWMQYEAKRAAGPWCRSQALCEGKRDSLMTWSIRQENLNNNGQLIKHKYIHYATLSVAPLDQILFLISWENYNHIIKMNVENGRKEVNQLTGNVSDL